MTEEPTPSKSPIKIAKQVFVVLLAISVCIVLAIGVFVMLHSVPPKDFPTDSKITIEPGASVSAIVEQFQFEKIVKSSELLYLTLAVAHDATDIQAGTYSFTEPLSVLGVAELITQIGPKDELVRITIPEGVRIEQIATIAAATLENFDSAAFLSYSTDDEGLLFPETYFVPKEFDDVEFYDLLRATYEEQTEPLQQQILDHPLTEEEILTLASILEREANSPESMSIVSGVLQNRLEIDMALQADASIEYVLNKPLSELTPADLKIDSPYNTYLYKGLPPTPIGNPGITAIKAVLNPTLSEYFFYITDPSGTFHYAETFAKHNQNIARYLR